MSDPLEILVTCEDGSKVLYRRCGFIPDLFASEGGHILRMSSNATRMVSGYPSVAYREGGISARSLVADAWMPGWRETGGTLEVIDGDKENCSVRNLRITHGRRGRPCSDVIPKKAEVYQAFKVFPDPVLLGEEFGMRAEEVLDIVKMFNVRLLRAYLKASPRRVRALHLTDSDFDTALAEEGEQAW